MSKQEETRWERRERKYRKRRYGMRVSGRSIKAVLLPLIGRKAEPAPRRTPGLPRARAGRPGETKEGRKATLPSGSCEDGQTEKAEEAKMNTIG